MLEGLKVLSRIWLTFISVGLVALFIASIALGYYLYFEVPMNMEPLIVDYSTGQPVLRAVESPHPYTPGWTDRLVLRVPYAKLRFENITLEGGDMLVVEQVDTAEKWTYILNGTGVLTSTFYSGPDGTIKLVIRIVDDGDGKVAWGVKARTYLTDIWALKARPYLFIIVYPVALPAVPAWGLAAFMQAFFTAMIMACWIQNGGFVRTALRCWKRPFLKALRNPLFAMPFVATALLVSEIGLTILMEALGVGAGLKVELPGPLSVLFEASYAVIAEEIGFRLIMIGLPLAVAASAKAGGREGRLAAFLKGLFCPGSLDPGLRRELRGLMAFLILVSSLVFGLTHVLFGGWEAGKAVTATLAGIVAGICFTVYGFHASVLLHWFFNYQWMIWYVAYELTGQCVLEPELVLFCELAVGALSLLVFLVQGLRLAVRRMREREERKIVEGFLFGRGGEPYLLG